MLTRCALPASSGASARHRAVDRCESVLYDLSSRLRAAEARQAHNLKVVSSIPCRWLQSLPQNPRTDKLQQGNKLVQAGGECYPTAGRDQAPKGPESHLLIHRSRPAAMQVTPAAAAVTVDLSSHFRK